MSFLEISPNRIRKAIRETTADGDLTHLWPMVMIGVEEQRRQMHELIAANEAEEWLEYCSQQMALSGAISGVNVKAAMRYRAQLAQDRDPTPALEDAFDATALGADADEARAWARGERENAALERCWRWVRHEGTLLLYSGDVFAIHCWEAERPDLVHALAQRLQDIARGAGEERWGQEGIWGPPALRMAPQSAVTLLRDMEVADRATHDAAMELWRAGRAAIEAEAARRIDYGFLRETLCQAFIITGPIGAHGEGWRVSLDAVSEPLLAMHRWRGAALCFARDGHARLIRAREQLSLEPEARRRRDRFLWEAAGAASHTFGASRATAENASQFLDQARRHLWAPERVGGDDTAGRELHVLVDAHTLRDLYRTHHGQEHCEGLRLVRDDNDARNYFLALGLAHEDPLHGRRRVSALWSPEVITRTEDSARRLAADMGYPTLGATSTWAPHEGLFGPVVAPSVPSANILGITQECVHLYWEWDPWVDDPRPGRMHGMVAEARCRACGRPLSRTHTWQLEPALEVDEDQAVARAHWWAALQGHDTGGIPETLADLRRRDERIPQQPPRRRTPRPQRSLRDALTGR